MLLALCALPGCGGDTAVVGIPVVAMDGWETVSEADDPFAAQRQSWHYCDPSGIDVEEVQSGQALAVDTGLCNFATVRQPMVVALRPGDTLRLELWHGLLDAPEVATATVVVATPDRELLRGTFPIPSPSQQTALTTTVDVAVSAGTTLYLHLNNHGDNAWNFLTLERL